MDDLLSEIAEFRTRHGMAKATFGALALNDKAFVFQLETGRRVWPETEDRVRTFMRDYRPAPSQAAAA